MTQYDLKNTHLSFLEEDCAVFCENDDIVFSGLMPKIRFERSGTLGKGADHCDFHFINNK